MEKTDLTTAFRITKSKIVDSQLFSHPRMYGNTFKIEGKSCYLEFEDFEGNKFVGYTPVQELSHSQGGLCSFQHLSENDFIKSVENTQKTSKSFCGEKEALFFNIDLIPCLAEGEIVNLKFKIKSEKNGFKVVNRIKLFL